MTHAAHGSFGRHFEHHHGVQPDGWWKLVLVVLIATAIGFALIDSVFKTPEQGYVVLPRVIFEVEVLSAPAQQASDGPAAPPAVISEPVQPADQAVVAGAPLVPPASPATAGGIRDVDFEALPLLRSLASQVYGRVDNRLVSFADVTGDGREEAIVPVTSDGTFGNLAYVVLRQTSGGPEVILTRLGGDDRNGFVLAIERGQLVATRGVYGPSDPVCCPGELHKTYYRWDGKALVYDRMETTAGSEGAKFN